MRALEAERPYLPKQINVYLLRRRYQWLWGQLVSRARQCAQAVKQKPDSEEARRELESALTRAWKVWRTWRDIDTANTGLYNQMATLYRAAGDMPAAWRVISTVIDRKPKDGHSYFTVGRWYVSHNDREAGQRWYGKAYAVEPTNGNWAWHRAELLRGMGRKEEARALYQEIATKKWQPRFQHLSRQATKRLENL
jgi:tetratricopeptide (TPR) repeat protein